METKRLFIALGISFVFIVMWSILFTPQPTISDIDPNNQIEKKKTYISPLKMDNYNQASNNDTTGNIEPMVISITTELFELILSNKGGGSIEKVSLIEKNISGTNRYNGAYINGEYIDESPVSLINAAVCNPCIEGYDVSFKFDRIENTPIILSNNESVIIKAELNGLIKTTTIYGNSYNIEHEYLNVINPSTDAVKVLWRSGLLPSEKNISEESTYLTAYMQEGEKLNSFSMKSGDEPFKTNQKNEWIAIKTKYFMKAILHENNEAISTKLIYHSNEGGWDNQFVYPEMFVAYNIPDDNILSFSSYIGPIDVNHLKKLNANLVDVFGFGWFIIGYLAKIVVMMLTSLYTFIPNYGIVCILFAIIIRILTGPLTKKSFVSNQKMQAIQPELKKVQEKFKDKPTQLNQEILALYKKHKVNPLGGCLPILVQMPLLIALFQVFRKTIEFRGASFLPFWITDLSQPDVIFSPAFLQNLWGINFFYGHGVALLPIIMGVIMMMNMKLSATSMQKSQMSTMYIMNIFFIMLFNTFPSGLNLYYTIYNLLNFIQQRRLKKIEI